MADRRGVKQYRFEKQGEEVVKTPLGKVKAIKVARIREGDSKRRTSIWFAPEWGYALVKLHQREDRGGGEGVRGSCRMFHPEAHCSCSLGLACELAGREN